MLSPASSAKTSVRSATGLGSTLSVTSASTPSVPRLPAIRRDTS